jgi:hypothetical protein
LEQLEPRQIAQRPKNARRPIQGSGGGVGNTRLCRVVAQMAFGNGIHFLNRRLLNSIISSNNEILREESLSSRRVLGISSRGKILAVAETKRGREGRLARLPGLAAGYC